MNTRSFKGILITLKDNIRRPSLLGVGGVLAARMERPKRSVATLLVVTLWTLAWRMSQAAGRGMPGDSSSSKAPLILVTLQDVKYLQALLPGGACVARPAASARIYRSAVFGLSGRLNPQELSDLRRCLPEGAIARVEQDLTVTKAEGAGYGAWWKEGDGSEPTVAASDGPAVTAAAGDRTSRCVDGPDTACKIQRKTLARVGLQAQKAISRLLKRSQKADERTVRRADGRRGSAAAAAPSPAVHAAIDGPTPGPDAPVGEAMAAQAVAAVFGRGAEAADGSGESDTKVATASSLGDKAAAARALWNLDRVDQRKLPLDGQFGPPGTGAGVTIYAIDSGINTQHQEFGQAMGGEGGSRASIGPDFLSGSQHTDATSNDCDGHGSHVASTAVGLAVGIARGARVVAVKVLDCDGGGAISDVVAALDWVAANAIKPAVVTMSLGVPAGNYSRVLEDAVRSVVINSGIPVVVAAGNSDVDACSVAPASVHEAITVAATNLPTKFGIWRAGDLETLYSWGNTGHCVDVLAPGVDIFAACASDARCGRATDDAYTWASGTSMAVPHVAGWAALYLERHPEASPAEVKAALLAEATRNTVQVADGTPDVMLFVGRGSAGGVPGDR